MKDIELEVDGVWTPATTVFSNLAQTLQGYAAGMDAFAAGLQSTIDAGGGGLPIPDGLAKSTLETLGIYSDGMTILEAQAAFQGASANFTQQSAETAAKGQLMGDQEVEAEKEGSGFTPIVSVHIQPNDMLNFSVKYEHTTKLELTNRTTNDVITGIDPGTGNPVTMFPDGEKSRLDLPAMLSLGATVKPVEPLLLSAGFHYFFDKNADWGGRQETLSSNSWELGIAAEYALTDEFFLSGGWIMTSVGATDEYQTDLSYTLPTYQGFSLGIGWDFLPNVQINVGGQYVLYQTQDRNFSHDFASSGLMVPVKETLEKSNWVIGAGVNFSFGTGR